MIDKLIKQMNKEILMFLGLSVVNIVFAAITLATGIVFIINNVFTILESETLFNISLGYVITGGFLAIIGFWWILPSASIMDFITDVKLEYYKSNDEQNEETIIALIIKMVSYFRTHKTIINKMILISRAGGVFFIANGIISSIYLWLTFEPSLQIIDYGMQIAAIFIMFSWGIIGLLLPRLISKFATIWEYRIEESSNAEEILREQLESK